MTITNEIFVVKRNYMGALFAGEQITITASHDSILVKALKRGFSDQQTLKNKSGKMLRDKNGKPKFELTTSGHWHHYAMEVRFAPCPLSSTKWHHYDITPDQWNQQLYNQFIDDLKSAGVI